MGDFMFDVMVRGKCFFLFAGLGEEIEGLIRTCIF
jgi:hypothetical protein